MQEEIQMSASVWVYPERTFNHLGDVRYQISWEEVRPEAVGKDEIDHDMDIRYLHRNFANKETAMKEAQKDRKSVV